MLDSICAESPDAETAAAATLLLRTAEGQSAEGADVLPPESASCCGGALRMQREGERESLTALRALAEPLAKCALLAVAAQLSPGGPVVVMFGGPMLEGFEPDRRDAMVLVT